MATSATDPAGAAGALPDADRAFERRRLHISATWAGMVRLDGDLGPESGSVVMCALGSLAEPAALDPGDDRTPQQRRADALVEICRRHLDTSERSRVGGERPHLVVTVDLDTLAGRGEALVDLDTGPVTLAAVRRLAFDATLSPVTAGSDGKPVAVARATRVVSPTLRRALHQPDQGCTHPGCDVPARWCDAHHLVHWADGGPTEAPTCGFSAAATTGWPITTTPLHNGSSAPQQGSWGRLLRAARRKA